MSEQKSEKVLRSLLRGLVFECPLGGNPEDCALHEIRKLPPAERIAWVQSLTHAECLEVYVEHERHLAQRERDIEKKEAD